MFDCFWISSGGSQTVLKEVSRVSVALWSSDEVSVSGCVEGFRELALLGEGDRSGSELLFSMRKWCGGNHREPLFKIVWLAYHGGYPWMCCFLSLLVGSLGLRGLALFQILRCGYSTTPSVAYRVVWSFCSRSSSLGMKL
ncbi:hypothetical protein F2Q69_00017128 [Brassica cretica]|uniref:Uncharacterized protein n=1 Tax=Brassica cretica TaxID=69181 RepID=A0A8S9R2D6_BRACR|nr:hypothetical protein F2Q69_00017128 [Brassica cretica]